MIYPLTRTFIVATLLASVFLLLLNATDGLSSDTNLPDDGDHNDTPSRRPGFGALPPLWSTGATHHITTGEADGNLTIPGRLAAFGSDVAQASLTESTATFGAPSRVSHEGQEDLVMSKTKKLPEPTGAHARLTLDGSEGCDPPARVPPASSPDTRIQAWILLKRGTCSFADKVRAAQAAGYAGVLVGDDGSSYETLVTMFAKHAEDISIASLFITQTSFRSFMALQTPDERRIIDVTIKAVELRTDWTLLDTLVFICFSPLCTLFIVYLILFFRRRRLRKEAILPPAYVAKLERLAYLPKEGRMTSCVICLETFEDDVNLVALPCGHLYHQACITRWLVERKKTCPICKRDVRASLERQDEEAEIESAGTVDERTPLLQTPPTTTQSETVSTPADASRPATTHSPS